jgi:branched-chain amino acid transport system ATP-binding protein
MTPRPALTLENVSREFGGLKAVDAVSLTVYEGERHVIIGPNGAGKTTLFNLISGELAATSGRIVMFGEDVTTLPPHRRAARGLARTFQITRLFANLTVHENVLLACMALDRRRFTMLRPARACTDMIDAASALVERFGLSAARHALARNLAYGDQRRLEVALSMAGRPRLLLLDEPMAGLSPAERESMQRLLAALDPAMAVLLIEHDIDMAMAFAANTTVLHQGAVLASGRTDDVAASASVQERYLGTPHGHEAQGARRDGE